MKACSRSGAVEQDEELGISSTSLSGRAALSRLLARYCQRRLLGIVHDAHREVQELCQQNAGTGARVVHPALSLGKHDDAHTAQPDGAARRFRDPRLRLQVQRHENVKVFSCMHSSAARHKKNFLTTLSTLRCNDRRAV